MNPPLCDIENAENLCEQHLKKALKVSPENIDALQNLANLRILRGKDEEAKKLLKKVVDQIYSKEEEKDDLPTIEFRM